MSIIEAPALDQYVEANQRLAGASPREILRWAVETYSPRLTMATAFGAEGCVLLHMLAEIDPQIRVFNLDTGYQFPETLDAPRSNCRALWNRSRDGPARHDGCSV